MIECLSPTHNIIGAGIASCLKVTAKATVGYILRTIVVHISARPENIKPWDIINLAKINSCKFQKFLSNRLMRRKYMRISFSIQRET